MPQDSTLETFYVNWEKYQVGLVEAIKPLTTEQLALRAAPNLRSVGELAQHIVGARAGWFHRMMGEGGEDIARIADWQASDAPSRSAAEIVLGLETTWQMMKRALDRWTPEDMAYIFRGQRQGRDYALAREWVIWHLIEHDVHHGGELSFTLGMHGLKALKI